MGEALGHEFSLSPVDTGRVTPGTPGPATISNPLPGASGQPYPIPGMSNPGGGPNVPGVAPQPVYRPSFLQSFLANLGPALAGGMAAQPGAPFGTGLGGALQGIEEDKRYRLQQQNASATRAREDALAAGTLANQQSEAGLRSAQIDALQLRPPEKPLGDAFVDADNNRVQYMQAADGSLRKVNLGQAAPKVPTAESVKVDFNGLIQKALTSVAPGFDPSTLKDPKALYSMVTNSTTLTPQEKNKAISYMVTNPEKSAMAGNLFYAAAQGDENAKKALTLETNQKLAVAKAAQAGLPAPLAGVAPHLVAPAAHDAQKAGEDYVAAKNAADDMNTFISMAKGGNKIAYSYAPTEGVLSFNTARGVKRVNMAEISQYEGAGSGADRVSAFFGKNSSGASIPDNILNDMSSIHEAIRQNAQNAYGDRLKVINETYGSSFKQTDLGPGAPPVGATMKVPGSDGKLHWSDGKKDLGVIH